MASILLSRFEVSSWRALRATDGLYLGLGWVVELCVRGFMKRLRTWRASEGGQY